MLAYRTEHFFKVPRTGEDILAFGAMIESRQLQDLPLEDFHHCPYIGLTGGRLSRPGCLLHPLSRGNEGRDFRWLSYYGGMVCHTYYCPAHRQAGAPVVELIRRSAQDWYVYGLFITETRLIHALSNELKKRVDINGVNSDIFWEQYNPCPMRAFMALKTDWPYRPGDICARPIIFSMTESTKSLQWITPEPVLKYPAGTFFSRSLVPYLPAKKISKTRNP